MFELYRQPWEILASFAALGVQRLRFGGDPFELSRTESESCLAFSP
ncbi:hypothetical protein GGP43_002992 [Salinibacter ruber]|nr:hypothetical protein [Salinibacter ruber]